MGSDGDAELAAGVGEGVGALAVLGQLQDLLFHLQDGRESAQHGFLGHSQVVTDILEPGKGLFDGVVHQLVIGLAVLLLFLFSSLFGLSLFKSPEPGQLLIRHFDGLGFLVLFHCLVSFRCCY